MRLVFYLTGQPNNSNNQNKKHMNELKAYKKLADTYRQGFERLKEASAIVVLDSDEVQELWKEIGQEKPELLSRVKQLNEFVRSLSYRRWSEAGVLTEYGENIIEILNDLE